MDVWDAAVMAIALLPNEGDDVETKLVLGERQSPFLFRAVGLTKVWTAPVETATNLKGESQDRLKSGDRAIVMIGGPHGLATGGTIALERLQGLSFGGDRSGGGTCHSRCLHE